MHCRQLTPRPGRSPSMISTLRRSALVLLVTLAGACLAAGCGGDNGRTGGDDPQDTVDAWLEAMCETSIKRSFVARDGYVPKAGGTQLAKGTCRPAVDQDDDVEAYIFPNDPTRGLVRVMDAWESGDGVPVAFAVTELDDGNWGALFAFSTSAGFFNPVVENTDDDVNWDVMTTDG